MGGGGKEAVTSEEIKKRLIESLRRKGLKLTRQRLEVVDILAYERTHPSARDIFLKARQRVPSISMSTVYYTLSTFKRDGAVKELEFCDRENRYESNIADHLDLVCRCCGSIEDYSGKVPLPRRQVESATGFTVDQIRFEYYGLCKGCRTKQHPC